MQYHRVREEHIARFPGHFNDSYFNPADRCPLAHESLNAVPCLAPRKLHAAWDTAVVYALEDSADSGNSDATAHKLEQLYAGQKDADSWKPGGTGAIAGESNQLARVPIYQALKDSDRTLRT